MVQHNPKVELVNESRLRVYSHQYDILAILTVNKLLGPAVRGSSRLVRY
jgi:hypothetical protein